MKEPIKIQRDELYEKVWAIPLQTLCKDFGLSDRGLAKVCARLAVPVPGRGHWRRVELGYTVKKKPLPPLPSNSQEQVVIHQTIKKLPEVRPEPIRVPTDLDNACELVKRSWKVFWKSSARDEGILQSTDKSILDVRVTRACLKRALCVMEGILQGFAAQGIGIEVTKEGHTVAMCSGQPLRFGISEAFRIEEHVGRHGYKTYEHKGTGRLSLKIETWNASGLRRTWADGKRQRIEECLNQFVGIMLELGPQVAAREAEREKERLAWEERERRERIERELRNRLQEELRHWRRAEEIREYFGTLEERSGNNEALREWIKWGRAYADLLDPIVALSAGEEPVRAYWEFNSRRDFM